MIKVRYRARASLSMVGLDIIFSACVTSLHQTGESIAGVLLRDSLSMLSWISCLQMTSHVFNATFPTENHVLAVAQGPEFSWDAVPSLSAHDNGISPSRRCKRGDTGKESHFFR